MNEKKIVSRYWKSLQNINTLLELCDILHVYDNSGDKPVRIIRKHKEQLSVFPNTLWSVDSILDLMNGNITEQK